MSTMARQQALLVAEAWQNLYANQSYIDFQSYSQDNLVNAILNYVKVNYPDSFNDWTSNSEFVIKVRTLAWLHQNISYRIDLDIRENFIQTATRREAILMLAENVFYRPNRVTGATGELRIESVTTNQPLTDSNSNSLTNIEVFWNDPANTDWFEQFILLMNNALTPRTQFGHPLVRHNTPPTRTDLYMFNARAPSSGVFAFNANVTGTSLPFGYINVSLDKDTGVISEIAPNPTNALRILYRSDGRGSGSTGTGFFLPIRQGTLASLDQTFSVPKAMQQVTLGVSNIDNGDIFVQQLDTAGIVIKNWTEVASLFGQGTAFNTLNSSTQTIYETHTLISDQVRVQFGDGKFGAIPTDRFRFWYRTVNPVALAVNISDIQKQSFVIPYVANNALYFLTIRASLVSPITNALPTDTNDAIKAAMGGAFAAQNRMVTASDYNRFPQSDSSILKVKTVNRTYSGHSAYAKIYDPTGLYNGIKVLGEDGRLYQSTEASSQLVSANTSSLTLDELVLQFLTPLVQKDDKASLYYSAYGEIFCAGTPKWANTSQLNGISKGNIKKSTVVIPVGPTALDEFQYLVPGTFIRYTSLSGPLIIAQTVVGTGTGTDGIALTALLPTDTVLYSLMPPIRNNFTADEQTTIKTNLFDLQDFGLSWNQITQAWVIITNSNLDKIGPFSLANQGDTTNTGKDASWMMRLHYIPNGTDGPQWQIYSRGRGFFFESAREVEFVYVNTAPLVDPNTGKLVRDNINILGANEGRDSLNRLGLRAFGPCCPLIYDFTSDGVKKCYSIRQHVIPAHVIVLVAGQLVTNYTITDTPVGDSICFTTAPVLGATISIRVSDNYAYGAQSLVNATSTGTGTFYSIGAVTVDPNNTFVTFNGVSQRPGDFTTVIQGANTGFYINPPLPSGISVLGYVDSGPSADIFNIAKYLGDAATTSFATHCPIQTIDTIIVLIDGIWQSPTLDYTLDTSDATNTKVVFITAPATNAEVTLHASLRPDLINAKFSQFTGTGSTTLFVVTVAGLTTAQVMVGVNGVVQKPGDYSLSGGILFVAAPVSGARINVWVVTSIAGFTFLDQNNTCFMSYLVDDRIFNAVGTELTPDGYTDIDGIEVAPVDVDINSLPDDPFEFDEILIPDGVTDLVLWRSIVQNGFSVWQPIDTTTVPKGTYGSEIRTNISAGIAFDSTTRDSGDIHLDQTTGKWLIADSVSGNWIVAPTQTDYKSAIGRSALKFIWTHYPADNTRIDPAISNIMDMYILPVSYDTAYRAWVSSGFVGTEPSAPTAESLQNAYDYFNVSRMTDDSLIFHPINYKPLFGAVADQTLQATFLAIKSSGSNLSDNDLILRIINAVDLFFAASNWDLGESFFLTELVAFIHRTVAPDLQSIVLVAKDGGPFGELFQIRSAPDELFISVAQPSDVKVVSGFNNDNLQIGVLTGQ